MKLFFKIKLAIILKFFIKRFIVFISVCIANSIIIFYIKMFAEKKNLNKKIYNMINAVKTMFN